MVWTASVALPPPPQEASLPGCSTLPRWRWQRWSDYNRSWSSLAAAQRWQRACTQGWRASPGSAIGPPSWLQICVGRSRQRQRHHSLGSTWSGATEVVRHCPYCAAGLFWMMSCGAKWCWLGLPRGIAHHDVLHAPLGHLSRDLLLCSVPEMPALTCNDHATHRHAPRCNTVKTVPHATMATVLRIRTLSMSSRQHLHVTRMCAPHFSTLFAWFDAETSPRKMLPMLFHSVLADRGSTNACRPQPRAVFQ